jgi:catechol 2,3-dioxygenase-like lactoylglutathione lyase family enzyme
MADGAITLKAVNHLTYNVKDKDRALRFWVDVLGVKQIPSQVDAEHIIWLQLPSGTMVHLIENQDAPSVPSHHGAFEVDDIEATAEALRSQGVETTQINTRNDGQRSFNVIDPDGNRVEICTRSGFGVLV